MTKYALYVRLEAKPGKEQEVAAFLSSALPLVNQEPDTTAWFALRMGRPRSAFSTRFQASRAGTRT